MIFIVATLLIFMDLRYGIGKIKGFILTGVYAIYLIMTIKIFC